MHARPDFCYNRKSFAKPLAEGIDRTIAKRRNFEKIAKIRKNVPIPGERRPKNISELILLGLARGESGLWPVTSDRQTQNHGEQSDPLCASSRPSSII
jgi:hypothetical protein